MLQDFTNIFLLAGLVSKSVSLNDILSTESKQTEKFKSIQRPLLPGEICLINNVGIYYPHALM